jgi:uncharacterized protein YjfI (DUF2170 family)
MAPRKSSYYQSRYRARLKELGYVKREIWIPADFTKVLRDCETALRAGVMPIIPKTGTERQMSQDENWTTQSLYEALVQSEPGKEGLIEIELIEGADPGILIIMKEFGDLPLLMSVSGSQIIVDSLLWPVDDVDDSATFNTMILKTHKLFPLSTFGIRSGADGRDYYEMFGSLSASSVLESVIFEFETLADNAIQAAEAYRSELKNVA